jgi:hypothetical protein
LEYNFPKEERRKDILKDLKFRIKKIKGDGIDEFNIRSLELLLHYYLAIELQGPEKDYKNSLIDFVNQMIDENDHTSIFNITFLDCLIDRPLIIPIFEVSWSATSDGSEDIEYLKEIEIIAFKWFEIKFKAEEYEYLCSRLEKIKQTGLFNPRYYYLSYLNYKYPILYNYNYPFFIKVCDERKFFRVERKYLENYFSNFSMIKDEDILNTPLENFKPNVRYKGDLLFDYARREPHEIIWCVLNKFDFSIPYELLKEILVGYQYRNLAMYEGKKIGVNEDFFIYIVALKNELYSQLN